MSDHLTPRHDHLTPRLLAAIEAGTLDEAEHALALEHLEGCGSCRARRRTLVATATLLGEGVELSPRIPDARGAEGGASDLDGSWTAMRARLQVERGAPPLAQVAIACVYCKGKLARALAVYCAGCLAPHHGECWEEHGRCAACAVSSLVRAEKAPRARPLNGRSRLGLVGVALSLAGAGTMAALTLKGPKAPATPPAVVEENHPSSTDEAPIAKWNWQTIHACVKEPAWRSRRREIRARALELSRDEIKDGYTGLALRALLDTDSKDGELLVALADALTSRGRAADDVPRRDAAEAVDLYRRVAALDPAHSRACLYREAVCLLAIEKYDEALKTAELLASTSHGSDDEASRAPLVVARAHEALGHHDLARTSLDRFCDEAREHRPAVEASLAKVELGMFLVHRGDPSGAHQAFESALAIAETPQAHAGLAFAFEALGEDERSLEESAKALAGSEQGFRADSWPTDLLPSHVGPYSAPCPYETARARARILELVADPSEIVTELDERSRAAQGTIGAVSTLTLAEVVTTSGAIRSRRQDDAGGALVIAVQGVSFHRADVRGYEEQARFYAATGDLATARNLIQSARSVSGSDPSSDLLALEGWCSAQDPAGIDAARGLFEAALAKDPTNAFAVAGLATAVRRKDLAAPEAQSLFAKARELCERGPAFEEASRLARKARLTLDPVSYRRARHAFGRAVLANPLDAVSRFRRARVALAFSDFDLAISDLEKAVSVDPTYREAFEALAKLHEEQLPEDRDSRTQRPRVVRDHVRAKHYWKTALEIARTVRALAGLASMTRDTETQTEAKRALPDDIERSLGEIHVSTDTIEAAVVLHRLDVRDGIVPREPWKPADDAVAALVEEASTFEKSGKLDEAAARLDRAALLVPSSARVAGERARVLLEVGAPARGLREAERFFEIAIERSGSTALTRLDSFAAVTTETDTTALSKLIEAVGEKGGKRMLVLEARLELAKPGAARGREALERAFGLELRAVSSQGPLEAGLIAERLGTLGGDRAIEWPMRAIELLSGSNEPGVRFVLARAHARMAALASGEGKERALARVREELAEHCERQGFRGLAALVGEDPALAALREDTAIARLLLLEPVADLWWSLDRETLTPPLVASGLDLARFRAERARVETVPSAEKDRRREQARDAVVHLIDAGLTDRSLYAKDPLLAPLLERREVQRAFIDAETKKR